MRSASREPRLRLLLALALALGLPPLLGAQERRAYSWNLDELRSEAETIGSLSPRLEGSRQELEALLYVRARSESLGAVVRDISYSESETVHSFSSGLEVSVSGRRSDTLLVVVPMDQRVSTPAVGSAAIALALQLVGALGAERPPIDVRVLFLGAEHGDGEEYPIGSRRYLEGFYPEGNVAVLYLDLERIPARMGIRNGANGIVAPYWLVREVTRSLSRARLGFRFRGNESQIYRMGFAARAGPMDPFLRAGYPALALETIEASGPPGEITREWLDGFADFVQGFLRSLEGGIPDQWDRHYLSFQVAGTSVALPEMAYVLILCLLVAGCLLLGVLSARHSRRYAAAFLRGSWSIPLHLGFLYLLALFPTLLIEMLLTVLNYPTLWEQAPLQLLLLKALLGFSLFALLTPLLTRSRLPRGDSFYSATAIVLLSVVLVGASLRDVSLAVYFAWALVFFLASARARGRPAKMLLFLVSPLLLARALVELFALGETELARWVLLERFRGSALVGAAVAPFYFMGLRLRLLFPARRRPRWRLLVAIVGLVALAGASATAAWIGLLRPYRGGALRPLEVLAVFDYDAGSAGLEIDCPIPIGEVTVLSPAGFSRTVSRSRHASMMLEPVQRPLDVTSSSVAFLDRQNVLITVAAPSGIVLWPYRLDLRLLGDDEFVVFDASFPFLREPSGREYAVRVGSSPPSPFLLELTLPRGAEFELRVRAEYLDLPPEIRVTSPGAVVRSRMEIRTTYRFRS